MSGFEVDHELLRKFAREHEKLAKALSSALSQRPSYVDFGLAQSVGGEIMDISDREASMLQVLQEDTATDLRGAANDYIAADHGALIDFRLPFELGGK